MEREIALKKQISEHLEREEAECFKKTSEIGGFLQKI